MDQKTQKSSKKGDITQFDIKYSLCIIGQIIL